MKNDPHLSSQLTQSRTDTVQAKGPLVGPVTANVGLNDGLLSAVMGCTGMAVVVGGALALISTYITALCLDRDPEVERDMVKTPFI